MTKYRLKIDTEAIQDIQNIIDWYNSKISGSVTIFAIYHTSRNPKIWGK